MEKGTHVWISDSTEAWVAGEVVEMVWTCYQRRRFMISSSIAFFSEYPFSRFYNSNDTNV